jgi:hypothetical protein
MKRSMIAGVVLGLAGGGLLAAPAQAVGTGNEGCTPGYWKNHTENWEEANAGQTLMNKGFDTMHHYDDATTTLLTALQGGGGSGLAGAEKILMRAAVAAWLNAAHDGLGYPLMRGEIVAMTNAAIASGDRAGMLAVAGELDGLNNLGCPL